MLLGVAAGASPAREATGKGEGEPQSTSIYFVAGFAAIFDDLQALDRLFEVDGIPAKAYPPVLWRNVVRDAVDRHRQNGDVTTIILIGHSVGARKVYQIAESLSRKEVPVALIVGLDPVRKSEVPDNVARAVNYFISPDVAFVVPGPGFDGQLINEIVADIAILAHGDIIYEEAIRLRAFGEIRQAIASPP